MMKRSENIDNKNLVPKERCTMVKKLTFLKVAVVLSVGFVSANTAFAATYHVRADGGTANQCTGTVNAAYPGSGINQPCAFSHPFFAISPIGNNPTKMVGGDTLIIANGQYKMGLGAPNTNDTAQCYQNWSWTCVMRTIPSGPNPTMPTRILGEGWDTGCANPPELWGTDRARQILDLRGSNNVEVQCLDITDHSSCQYLGPQGCNTSTAPFGPYAVTGVEAADSTNVLFKNVNVHGLYRAFHAGRLTDWTLENVGILRNSFVGWDGDIGSNSANSGTMTFNRVKIQYNGCGDTYPDKQPHHCYSQDQSGYGDGLGTYYTGGNWVFNNVDFSHNVSDGMDLLYHNGQGTITIKRSKFEGNAGNQVKVAIHTNIENSVIIGNCGYFQGKSFTNNPSTFNHCRAGGTSVALKFQTGTVVNVRNSTITSNGDVMLATSGSLCNGTTERVISRNNIYLGRKEFFDHNDKAALIFNTGATGNGGGACGQIPFDDDYSVIFGTKYFTTDCNNKPHSACQDPKLAEPLVDFYTGDAFNANLQSLSPARDASLLIVGLSPLDYNEYDRGVSWDVGALEYGSVPGSGGGGGGGGALCGNRVVESPETCDDGNTINGDGCSSTCQVEPAACGNNRLETGEQCDDGNTTNWDGCSSTCQTEVPICGNNHRESGEQCDDGNTTNGDGCSATCLLEQSMYQFMVSYSSNRSGAVVFPNQIEARNAYIFVTPVTGVSQVKFYLDDPSQAGTPRQTENLLPFDFAGTASNGAANPFNAAALSTQQHTITAAVKRTDNTVSVVSVNFTVNRDLSPVTVEAENMSVKTTGVASSGGWKLLANGRIGHQVNLPVSGQYRVDIIAKGQLAGSQVPNMRLK